jgi:MFS family permease
MPAIPPALKHYDFRVFWSGQALSNFGSQFTTVAMAWQIYQLTNSPLAIGLLGLARALPQMGLLLFGGLLADAFDRRRLLMVVQLLQLCVSAFLAVLTVVGAITPGALLAAAALFAVCTGLGNPSRQAFVPNLVPREDLGSALAVNNTAGKLANVAGPAAGGVALAAAGATLCYTVDAVSWLAMLAALVMIRTRRPSNMGRPRIAFSALSEGLSFLRGQPVLLAMLALDFGASFFGGPNALLPIYARDLYHVGPQGLGILFGASSAGSFLAAAGLSVLGQPRDVGRWVLVGLTAYGLCAMAFAFSPRFPLGFAIGVVMLACMGCGDTFNAVIRTTVNQTLTPDELRGRVSSVSNIFTSGGPQLSQVESGVTAAWWGAEGAAFVGGLMTLMFVAAVAFTPGLWRFRLDRSTEPLASAGV